LVIAARSPPMGISSCCLSCLMPMRFHQSRSFRILTLTCGLAIASGGLLLFKGIQASDARSRSHLSEVGFFQGNWECKLKNSPYTTFQWKVAENLENSWLTGVAQLGDRPVSNDFWRVSNGKIERFAFTSDGQLFQIESRGWESEKLTFSGTANNPTETYPVRATITKISDNTFHAIWEKQGKDEKWSTLSDEQCTK
jgi:hypothetical protein